MKNLFLFIFLLSTTYSIGQAVGPITSPSQGRNTGLISSNNRYGSKEGKGMISYDEAQEEYEDVDGSPFLYGKEITVDFIFHNDSIIKDVPIRYDLYNKEIIVTKEDGGSLVLDQNYYKGFIYDNEGEEELYLRLQPNDPVFYNILFSSDDFYFCKKTNIRLAKVDRYIPGQDIKPGKFVLNLDYFVKQKNFLVEVKLNNGKAFSDFPLEYKQQIPQLKQELGIKKIRKEEDYIQIIRAFE